MQNVCPSGRLILATFSKFAFMYSTTSCALAHGLRHHYEAHTHMLQYRRVRKYAARTLSPANLRRTTMVLGQPDTTKQHSRSSRLAMINLFSVITSRNKSGSSFCARQRGIVNVERVHTEASLRTAQLAKPCKALLVEWGPLRQSTQNRSWSTQDIACRFAQVL